MLIRCYKLIIILSSIISFTHCNNISNNYVENQEFIKENISYAKHFNIFSNKNTIKIEVINPWQNVNDVKFTYYFGKTEQANTENIKLPIKRVICLSTSHVGFLKVLGLQNKLVGVSGTQFINDSITNKLISENKIKDVGYEQNLNYELILALKPDLIIAYNVENKNSGYITKLKDLGIKVIFIAEYLEETPLGKAEWLKLFGAIFDKQKEADSIFKYIEKEYNNLKQYANNLNNNPTVFTGLPWKDSWYIAGTNSYLSAFIKDAGGNYVFNNNSSTQSFPMAFEKIFQSVQSADIWINSGSANNLQNILTTDSRLAFLKAFKNKNIYNNNNISNSNGGNDYWESGVVNPQIILKDLIKIFHPDAFKNYSLYYYKKIDK